MNEYLSIDTIKKLATLKKIEKFIKKHKKEIKYADEILKMIETKKEYKVWK